jgi:hypothetical protein
LFKHQGLRGRARLWWTVKATMEVGVEIVFPDDLLSDALDLL